MGKWMPPLNSAHRTGPDTPWNDGPMAEGWFCERENINLWNFSYFYLLRENQWRYSETEVTSGFRALNVTSSQSPRNFYAARDVYLRGRYSVYVGGRNILIWTDFLKCPISSIVLSERITPHLTGMPRGNERIVTRRDIDLEHVTYISTCPRLLQPCL